MVAKDIQPGLKNSDNKYRQKNLDIPLIRVHLQEILTSPAFRVSRRSIEFLTHIVEKTLAGRTEELKERSLGVELFGRSASYDTGADAIVRVTASDVRRRLHQYYSDHGSISGWRVDLPSGSYIPEFSLQADIGNVVPAETVSVIPARNHAYNNKPHASIYILAVLLFIAMGVCGWLWHQNSTVTQRSVASSLPWSGLLSPQKDLRIILCDPDISLTQELLNFQLSLSDYANQQYIPPTLEADPMAKSVMLAHRGTNVAAVDARIAMNISSLATPWARSVKTHTARSLNILDFKTEDNFIILGSPRSNPWMNLFREEMDFRFEFDQESKREIVRNHRPAAGESPSYFPTAKGWGTGDAYALISFLPNPSNSGNLLFLAGSNAEATEAAGKLVMDHSLLRKTVVSTQQFQQQSSDYFEILLRVMTMAGSPDKFEVVACHIHPFPKY